MIKSNIMKVGVLAILFAGFYLKNLHSLDPDFGWHIRIGEIILASGIPVGDPLSYTMKSYPFINHEWLSDVITFLIFRINNNLLNLVFAGIALVVFLVSLPKRIDKLYLSIMLLSANTLYYFSGVRMQEITWVFFAIFLRIIFDIKLWKKLRFLLPLLMLLWANMHGAFVMALVVFLAILITRLVIKRNERTDFFILFLSIAATFINPYGWKIWTAVFSQGLDLSIRLSVVEWLPSLFFYSFSFWLLVAFMSVLTYKYFKKIPLVQACTFVIIAIFATSAIRNIPFLIITILLIAPKLLGEFYKEVGTKDAKNRLSLIAGIIVAISAALFISKLFAMTGGEMTEDSFYPKKAINFLNKNLNRGELFSLYDWGGYLSWKFPSKKTFVDGRMPSWRWDAPLGESDSAYKEYIEIMSGKANYKLIFEKYNIKYALLPNSVKNASRSENLIQKVIGIDENQTFETKLINDGWRRVYADNNSIVLFSPN